jgi:hypothetical protein
MDVVMESRDAGIAASTPVDASRDRLFSSLSVLRAKPFVDHSVHHAPIQTLANQVIEVGNKKLNGWITCIRGADHVIGVLFHGTQRSNADVRGFEFRERKRVGQDQIAG